MGTSEYAAHFERPDGVESKYSLFWRVDQDFDDLYDESDLP